MYFIATVGVWKYQCVTSVGVNLSDGFSSSSVGVNLSDGFPVHLSV